MLAELGVRLPDREDSFYQFDLAVTCAPADPARRYVAEPELIVEVLSPSTALHDGVLNSITIARLASLNEILLVASGGTPGAALASGRHPFGWSTT